MYLLDWFMAPDSSASAGRGSEGRGGGVLVFVAVEPQLSLQLNWF